MSIDKLHFSNFFNVVNKPVDDLLVNEFSLTPLSETEPDKLRLVYKDTSSKLHYFQGTDAFDFLTNPGINTFIQTEKEKSIADFGDVNVNGIIPESIFIEATGINERQVLIQYDLNNKVKDILLLPKYFCKLGNNADTFDVNSGLYREIIRKTEIVDSPTRQELVNNAIFKVMQVNPVDVYTSFNYPVTVEANKDNILNRNQIYIGSDNFLYIITDKTIANIPLPFFVFNTKTEVKESNLSTTFFFIEQTDKFIIKTYRTRVGIISDTSIRMVEDSENVAILEILKSNMVEENSVISDDLTVSVNFRSIDGINVNKYYNIVVSTNETKLHPKLTYKISDVPKGFFNKFYKLLKDISDNGGGSGDLAGFLATSTTSSDKKFIFKYDYIATSTTSSFEIPEETFSPENGDNEILIYKGIFLERNIDYTRADNSRLISLSFSILSGELIQSLIFKYGGSTSGRKFLYKNVFKATIANTTSFTIPLELFDIESGDREILSYKNIILEKGVDYTRAADSRTVVLSFPMAINDEIHTYIVKYYVSVSGEKNYLSEYVFTSTAANTTYFDIPEVNLNPDSNDTELLFYKGSNLDRDVEYTRDINSRRVNLNFSLNVGEKIYAYIIKIISPSDESNIVGALQTTVTDLTTKVSSLEIRLAALEAAS